MADAYLDTSALVKRYVEEPGTVSVDVIFDGASEGSLNFATSAWNIGEAFGVFDYRRRRKLLTEHEFHVATESLASEFIRLMGTKALKVYPVRASLLTEAWSLIFNQQLYEADALQIVTCNASQSSVLITSDQLLRRASEEVGLRALDPQEHAREVRDVFG